ncbi:hypothetical protein [Roseibacillus persicicus]|uniref:hypothetical protein n=1 Tax=Roseibacillus persicicus TaxID=454148 RepID=UPI0028101D02|nr:hypothetical protein [Roseibacillus persicicus]MDQ8191523.1 hypothetical protein [Roseibacillus persicicus]
MKFLPLLLIGFTSVVFGSEPIVEIDTIGELASSVDRRVVLEGVYLNPGKGFRSVDCGFMRLRIRDYSFMTESKGGVWIEEIKSGQKIRFEAVVRFFKGRKSPVKNHPVVQEERPPKQTIDGVDYYVYPPSYSIAEAKLIEVVESDEEVHLQVVPNPKSEEKAEP